MCHYLLEWWYCKTCGCKVCQGHSDFNRDHVVEYKYSRQEAN